MGLTGRETQDFSAIKNTHKSQRFKISERKLVSHADVSSRRNRATAEGMLQLQKARTELARGSFHYRAAAACNRSVSLNRFVTKCYFTQMSGVLLYCLPRFYFECLSWCICPFIMYETCMTWRLWSILWGRWINTCNCICRTYCLVTEPFSGAELSAAGMDVTLEVNWCSRGNPTCSDI